MPFDIAAIGANAANSAIGTGMGMILGAHNDRRQLKQQEKLQNLQIKGQQQMTDYNMSKQLQMWKDTSYGAQKEQMIKAGLNPGLMYGMSGGGGQSTGTANGNVSGGTAQQNPGEVQGMGIAMLNAQLLKAQKENIEANTGKTIAETGNVGKTGANIEASTASLTQGIQNQKAVEQLTKTQNRISDIDAWVKEHSKEDLSNMILWESQKVMQEMEILRKQNLVDNQTMDTKVDMAKAQLAGQYLENALTRAQTTTEGVKPAVLQQQIQTMIREGIQKWRALEIEGNRANVDQRNKEQQDWVNDVSNSMKLPIDIVEKVAQAIIFKQIISPDKQHTPIKGFQK